MSVEAGAGESQKQLSIFYRYFKNAIEFMYKSVRHDYIDILF